MERTEVVQGSFAWSLVYVFQFVEDERSDSITGFSGYELVRDRGACHAAVHGAAKSRARLSN